MGAFLGIVAAVLALVATPILVMALIAVALRKEWTAQLDGRPVTLVAGAMGHLFVDGLVVARTVPTGTFVLEGVVDHPIHGPRRLSGWVRYQWSGAVEGHLFADGQPIGGDPLPPGPWPVSGPVERTDPTDPRWAAVKPILVDLAASKEARVRAAATDLARTLRELFERLHRIDRARESHAALGDGSGVETAAAEIDARLAEALALARELHVRALAGPVGGLEAETDLLSRLRAETEVDRVARERLARTARRETQ